MDFPLTPPGLGCRTGCICKAVRFEGGESCGSFISRRTSGLVETETIQATDLEGRHPEETRMRGLWKSQIHARAPAVSSL